MRCPLPASDVRHSANGTDMAPNTTTAERETGSDRDKQAPHYYLLNIAVRPSAASVIVLTLALVREQRLRQALSFIAFMYSF